ncbi:MAG: hypothetical protein ACI8XB_003122 [Patiriisocius sp.]|jgi:hypothetical protein
MKNTTVISYKSADQWVFNIDTNGDNFLSFSHCVDLLRSNPNVIEIEHRPPWWDNAFFVFNWKSTQLKLIFMEFGGTDLRVSSNIQASFKDEIAELALNLIKNLDGRTLTK